MVQNVCKNSLSGGKSRKNGIHKIHIFFAKKSPKITGFHELTPKLKIHLQV